MRLAGSCSGKVVFTTTTHIGLDQVEQVNKVIIEADEDIMQMDWGNLEKITCITGPSLDGNRLTSLTVQQLSALSEASKIFAFSVLIEADGARMLPLKAPGKNEPVIPEWVDTVIVVAGLSAVGRNLDDKSVFRPEEYAKLSGITLDNEITPNSLKEVLCHESGGLKRIPDGARRILILNQADAIEQVSEIMRIAIYCNNHYDQVLIGSIGPGQPEPDIIARVENTAGIILAGGGATRMYGEPKQLLEFQEETLLERAIITAKKAGLAPIIVVTGYQALLVKESIRKLDVEVVDNPDWRNGQSTSIKAGLRQLGSRSEAAVFMLVDQPFVPVELINTIVAEHITNMVPIIAPMVDDTRSNPVLFDRVTFTELMSLSGETGGRGIMGLFKHSWIPWLDKRLLLDIDTPEDLEKCIHAA
jgi:molybdenum cofactor cytidylyltransferase